MANSEEKGSTTQIQKEGDITLSVLDTNLPSMAEEPDAVIAIDIGASFSGFAISLKDRKDVVLTATHGSMLDNDKVPSIMLLNPDHSLNSFGFDASKNYEFLSAEVRKKYHYIENFRTVLYNSWKLTKETVLTDIQNREISAMHVFSEAIGYFHDLAYKTAKSVAAELEEDGIQWILPIPAVWTDSSKQFIREAAIKAGIKKEKLRLVLEPEAGALFYQKLIKAEREDETEDVQTSKFILAHISETRADFCVYETIPNGKIREVYRDKGENFQGNSVNESYLSFLIELFGQKIWNEFRTEYVGIYSEMMYDFERKKVGFCQPKKNSVTIPLPPTLLNLLKADDGKSLQAVIKSKPFKKSVNFHKDTDHLMIKGDLMKQFFKPSINTITRRLRDIMMLSYVPNIKTLMLAGSYAKSQFVKERLEAQVSQLKIISHADSRLAVLKGGVMMGFMPRNIFQRRAQYTYGFACIEPFRSTLHPEELKVEVDGEQWCDWVFRRKITLGQDLRYGDVFTLQGYGSALDPDWKHIDKHTSLWRSTQENPCFCSDEGCEQAGLIVHKPPPGGWPENWLHETQLIVGETEFTVKYINIKTGEEYETHIDFL